MSDFAGASRQPIVSRPDLSELFGILSPEVQERLLDQLIALNLSLEETARDWGAHLRTPFHVVGFDLWVGPYRDAPPPAFAVSAAEVIGEVSGNPGDGSFSLAFAGAEPGIHRKPPWEVHSNFVVFCSDLGPITLGYSCLHPIADRSRIVETPDEAIPELGRQVESIREEILAIPTTRLLSSRHSELEIPHGEPSPEMVSLDEVRPFLDTLDANDRDLFVRYFRIEGASPGIGDERETRRLGGLHYAWAKWRSEHGPDRRNA